MEEQNLSKFSIFNPNLLIQDWFDPNLTWPLIIIFNTKRVREVKDIHCDKMSYTDVSKSMRGGVSIEKKTIRLTFIDPAQESNLRSLCIFRANTNSKYRVWKLKTFPRSNIQIFPFLLDENTWILMEERSSSEETQYLNFLDYADGESRMVNTNSPRFLLSTLDVSILARMNSKPCF